MHIPKLDLLFNGKTVLTIAMFTSYYFLFLSTMYFPSPAVHFKGVINRMQPVSQFLKKRDNWEANIAKVTIKVPMTSWGISNCE